MSKKQLVICGPEDIRDLGLPLGKSKASFQGSVLTNCKAKLVCCFIDVGDGCVIVVDGIGGGVAIAVVIFIFSVVIVVVDVVTAAVIVINCCCCCYK